MASYITQAEAQTYFDERLSTDAWDLASSSDRDKSLAQATRIINSLYYKEEKTSSTQTNAFPRGGYGTVPDDINYACAEIALALLDDVRPEYEYESLRIQSETHGQVKAIYNEHIPAHTVAGVPSIIAWRYLLPYLRDGKSVRLTEGGNGDDQYEYRP